MNYDPVHVTRKNNIAFYFENNRLYLTFNPFHPTHVLVWELFLEETEGFCSDWTELCNKALYWSM